MTNNLRNNEAVKQTGNKIFMALAIAFGLLLAIEYLEYKMDPTAKQMQALQASNPLTPNKSEIFNKQTPSLEKAKPIEVATSKYTANIDLIGGKITSLKLNDYLVEKDSTQLVSIFNKKSEDKDTAMLFDAGWLSNKFVSPDANTAWALTSKTDNKIVLTYKNSGLTFTRTFIFDDSFTTTVIETVKNQSGEDVQLAHYAQLHHIGEREDRLANSFTNYTGPEALVDDEKVLADYDDLKDGKNFDTAGKNIWSAITNQYFAAAIIPDNSKENNVQFKFNKIGQDNYYTALVRTNALQLANNQELTETFKLYAGPKSANILEQQNVPAEIKLDTMLDYGWFHAIAKPMYDAIIWFNNHVNSLALSIIIVTIILKTLLFPLATKSYTSMAKMRKIQPEMKKIQEKYGNDRQAMGLEMMQLYKKHQVNPASGCWPIFIQIPIFFAMYKVILMSFEFRQAELGLWISDMSMKDPYFVLPILMGISMIIQQRMNPQPLDETQQMVMKIMPVAFTALFLFFPSGLVLYWLTNNVISIVQQYLIMKKHNA